MYKTCSLVAPAEGFHNAGASFYKLLNVLQNSLLFTRAHVIVRDLPSKEEVLRL